MQKPDLDNSFFIVGPTASGKSSVALSLAEMIGGEIISLDSMQLWRGMNIGTATPTAEEQARVPHHLIDILEPSESFSVAKYVELAEKIVHDIAGRGRIPMFVGGTALYLKALTAGLFEGPSADWGLRNRLKAEAAEHGSDHLHQRLQEIDPAAAEKIHPNDLRRVIRALEVYELTGTPISEMQQQWKEASEEETRPIFGISRERQNLYDRINRRVDQMMEEGFLDEVKWLLEQNPGKEATQALGYKKLIACLNGDLELDEAVELIKRNTRRFAKRQMTWFRTFPQIIWITAGPSDTAEKIAGHIREHLENS